MKPEPLKDKVFYFDNLVFGMGKPKDQFVLPKVNLEDIKSAVEWLKQELNNPELMLLDEDGNIIPSSLDLPNALKIINKAFQDVIKK